MRSTITALVTLLAACGGGGSGPGGDGGRGSVTISPRNVRVAVGAQQPFACTVVGRADVGCDFRVVEDDGGAVNTAGVYSAPTKAGTYHVVATSQVDAAESDTAVVTVTAPVATCDALPAAGTWENISPTSTADAFAIAVDPVNAGTMYLGTIYGGLYKTTDCGATFTHLNTGRNAADFDAAMVWTISIDPQEPDVVYANAGYGTNDLYRSDNGGVDWDVIWPPDDVSQSSRFGHNFVNTVEIDPFDHEHLLLTFHEKCDAPQNGHMCIAESHDRGATWTLLDGDARWTSDGEGVRLHVLENGDTWLWTSQADGMWRTDDAGATWTEIGSNIPVNHLQPTRIYRASDGTFYMGGLGDLWRSPKGTSAGTWTAVTGTNPLPGSVTGDGTNMYVSRCFYGGFCSDGTTDVVLTSPESDGETWTPIPAPSIATLRAGGTLALDRTNRVLYSSNLSGGLFRLTLE